MCGKIPFGDDMEDDPNCSTNILWKVMFHTSFITDEKFMNLINKMLLKNQNKRLSSIF